MVVSISTAFLVAIVAFGAVGRARVDRSRIESEAETFLETADRLLIETKVNPDVSSDMRVGLERHKARLEPIGGDGDTLRRIKTELARLQSQDRDRRMVRELEEARLVGSAINDNTFEQKDNRFEQRASVISYRNAFRSYGIDLESLSEQKAVELIRNSAIRAELVAAIDDWRHSCSIESTRTKLLSIAGMADGEPLGVEIREAIADRNVERLKRLSSQIDARSATSGVLCSFAWALRSLHEDESAISLLRQAQGRYPDNLGINYDLSEAHRASLPPRFDEAIRYSTAALALRPKSPAAFNHHGVIQYDLGDHSGAAVSFRKSIELKPDSILAHYNLGNVLFRIGDWTGAVKSYQQAIHLEPDFAEAHNNLGVTCGKMGNLRAR